MGGDYLCSWRLMLVGLSVTSNYRNSKMRQNSGLLQTFISSFSTPPRKVKFGFWEGT